MALQIIEEAIAAGAPAYNAGQIALCADIYQAAAQQLLGSHLAELSPQVARDLEESLFKSQAAAGAREAGGKNPNELAWAFRRAFDMQLEIGTKRVNGPARSVAEVVAQAISQGAPAYNRGDKTGCARLYAATARSLMDRNDIDESARMMLASALQQSERSRNADSNAWTLRRALDAMAGGSASGGSTSSLSRTTGSVGSSGKLIHDFTNGDGMEISASVVNDTVMGGRSSSAVSIGSDGAIFEGTVTKRGGGGFAAVRFESAAGASFVAALFGQKAGASLADALRGTSGLAFDVSCMRGCKAWKIQLNEGYDATTWQADFTASNSAGMQRVPFSAFVPTWRGRPQGRAGLTDNSLDQIRSFGFMLSFLTADGASSPGFEEGPFVLRIARVETYRG